MRTKIIKDEFYSETTKKTCIVLHHTAGYKVKGSISWLNQLNAKARSKGKSTRINVHYWIDRSGKITQTIPEENWAWHTGTGSKSIDKQTISIELANLGGIRKKNGSFIDPYNRKIAEKKVFVKNGHAWRGFWFFEDYPQKQIDALIKLILGIQERHDIRLEKIDLTPKRPVPKKNWQALLKNGLICHTHLRKSKVDLSPAIHGKDLESLYLA